MKIKKVSINDFQTCTSLEFEPPNGIKILPKTSKLDEFLIKQSIINGGVK